MSSGHPEDLPPPLVEKEPPTDLRLYAPFPKGWSIHIQGDGPREYCHFKTPGEDYFHLLVPGEVYLAYNDVKYCFNCAFRFGHITNDRLFWQNSPRRNRDPAL